MSQNRGRDSQSWQREHVVEILRKTGYADEAEEAGRTLPQSVDMEQILEFARDHGLSRDELISRMGGSS